MNFNMIKFIFQVVILYLILLFFSKIFSFLELFFSNSLSVDILNLSLIFSLFLIGFFVLFFQFLILELKDLASVKLFISVLVLMLISNIINLFYTSLFNFNYSFLVILVILFLVIYYYEKKFRNKFIVFGLNQSLMLLFIVSQLLLTISFPSLTQMDLNEKISNDLDSYHKNSLDSIELQSRSFIVEVYSNELSFLDEELCQENLTCSTLLTERKSYFENNLEINFSLNYNTLQSFFYSSYMASTLFLFVLNFLISLIFIYYGFKYLKYAVKPVIWIFDPFNVLRF